MGANAGGIASIVGGVGQLYGAHKQAEIERSNAQIQADQLEFNKRAVEMQRQDVLDRADRSADLKKMQISQTVGAQKAGFAAGNIDLSSGTVRDVQASTEFIGQTDIDTIRNNAFREAFGLQMEATQLDRQANFTRRSGDVNAAMTIAGGGLKLAGASLDAYSMSKGNEKPNKGKAPTSLDIDYSSGSIGAPLRNYRYGRIS